MDAHQYLAEIKSRLITSPIVDTFTIVEERDLDDRGYFRARVTLTNNDFLEIAEYFVLVTGQPTPDRYRYQWMDSTQQVLRKRWDNVRHFPGLDNFPHHVHISSAMTLQDLQQQVVQLPVRDRWQLVQTLLASIQQDTESTLNPSPSPLLPNSSTETMLADLHPWTKSFIGILQSTSDDGQDAYIDYLEEKYA